MKRKISIGIFYLFIAGVSFVNSQINDTLTGFFLDKFDNPLMGGTVRLLNTTYGTISDENGYFQLLIGDEIKSAYLIADYIGYISDTIILNDFSDTVRINLIRDSSVFSYTKIIPIDSTIRFSFSEEYSDDTTKLKHFYILNLYTEKYYPCYNYRIDSFLDTANSNIKIDISGIFIPDICMTAFGPATNSFIINLEEEKSYNLIFNYGKTDNYKLVVLRKKLELFSKGNTITQPESNVFFRMPKNSFAFYCGTMLNNKYACEDCIDFIKDKVNLEEYYFKGNGVVPYFSDTSRMGHYYNASVRYFIYPSEKDFKKVASLIKEYSKLNNYNSMSGTSFNVLNWKKEEVHSNY